MGINDDAAPATRGRPDVLQLAARRCDSLLQCRRPAPGGMGWKWRFFSVSAAIAEMIMLGWFAVLVGKGETITVR